MPRGRHALGKHRRLPIAPPSVYRPYALMDSLTRAHIEIKEILYIYIMFLFNIDLIVNLVETMIKTSLILSNY